MKYGYLKGQGSKSFKIRALSGGLDYENLPDNINDNQISDCKNMWYKNSRLKTRPGFRADSDRAVDTMIYGYTGELEYKVTDTAIYLYDEYYRIATADITTDDYAHYTYVYLVDLYGNITPAGYLSFLRIASDVFYLPTHINFFNGKPQNGGGIYALVTLCDKYNIANKNHHVYEINADFTEWERVYDYYIPTALINGRGNRYQVAKNETAFSAPNPTVLESQNMLESRFYSYYTSDGYSNSFVLPFNSISNGEVSCRIYYSLDEYTEWVIPAGYIRDIKEFREKEITAYIDRTTGTLYFKDGPNDYPIPIMEMCGQNNIKVTASKDITDGIAKIAEASCVTRYNSKLLVAGGKNGNTVYISDYDNPLYFPNISAQEIGESNSPITYMSSQQGKVLVFKDNELHLLTVKDGDTVNEITLLHDNDKVFKKAARLTSEQISQNIGCDNKATVSFCNGRTFWLGGDNTVYNFEVKGKKINKVCACRDFELDYYNRRFVKAVGGDDYYILISGEKIIVVDSSDLKNFKIFYWETPSKLNIESGFYFSGKHFFLCTGSDSQLAFIATLEGKTDSILYFSDDEERTIMQKNIPVTCGFATKHYSLGNKNDKKNIEGIYLNLAAKGRVKIAVNEAYKTDVNFGFLNEDYDKCEYKSVRLSPHIYNTNMVTLKLESDKEMSIGEIEIRYRVMG